MRCTTSQVKDIPILIKCHKSAFPNALSSKLGHRFTSKMFEWYILNERGVLFHVLDNENKIIGYCGGIITSTSGQEGAFTSITQFAFKTFLLSYLLRPWLIFHKETLKKFSSIKRNILIKLGKNENNEVDLQFEPYIGLIVIGVKKIMQGKGIGQVILKEFENRAKKLDFKLISLSVKSSNNIAISSYLKSGWNISQELKDSLIIKKNI